MKTALVATAVVLLAAGAFELSVLAAGWTDSGSNGSVITAACLFGTPSTSEDIDGDGLDDAAEQGLGTDPCDSDTDQDGCRDGAEIQTAMGSENSGGRRNPLSRWDYFNPTHDGMNRADDIIEVVDQYFIDAGNPAYRKDTDRTYLGPNPWNLGPPDGLLRAADIIHIVKQYFHDCA